jgi:hypothetical protein
MRKILVAVAFSAVALGGLAACAHPTPPDGYGPPTTGPATQAPTSAAPVADQTVEVCQQAESVSASAVVTIRAKGAAATAALQSGDQVTLVQAVTDLKKAAADWAAQLTVLSGKPIKPAVKTVLTDGVTTINTLAAAQVPPPDAESKLTDFTTKLAAACA